MLQQTKQQIFIKSKKESTYIDNSELSLAKSMATAWKNIAPTWPLQSYIARNPLVGLENMPFIDALNTAAKYFEDIEIPEQMLNINRETIKWCQALFDHEQSTISIPFRRRSVYATWKDLVIHDKSIHGKKQNNMLLLKSLPDDPFLAVEFCLEKMSISAFEYTKFFTLLLVTLPGWSGYVKYLVEYPEQIRSNFSVELIDYIALRTVTTLLLWPQAADILRLPLKASNTKISSLMEQITSNEMKYSAQLLQSLLIQTQKLPNLDNKTTPQAQIFFCIDVRSEPFRRAIESQGEYETLGYAGFFGVPVSINKYGSGQNIASCPVLIKPKHQVCETHHCEQAMLTKYNLRQQISNKLKSIYKSLKYGFTTPFLLVEILGPVFALLLALRSLQSGSFLKIKKHLNSLMKPNINLRPSKQDISSIEFSERCLYAKNALQLTGLVDKFAPIILLCGHKSCTENNPYASALDCGACGGNKGGFNAQVLCEILNDRLIRDYLRSQNILIPDDTVFIAAEHNTTTDEVIIFDYDSYSDRVSIILQKLKQDLLLAKKINNKARAKQMQIESNEASLCDKIAARSTDWSQTRPEWGLARNASFIVGPRNLTKDIDLDGRAFLHSYDWRCDNHGTALETILTAPMVVAQWINSQYLFSTANNIAYGSGSKVTQNITGKIGIMQGNASDLMHGLPIQSVKTDDATNYHELLRMATVVYAPRDSITAIIKKHQVLQDLFSNNWVILNVIDPLTNKLYIMDNQLNWQNYEPI